MVSHQQLLCFGDYWDFSIKGRRTSEEGWGLGMGGLLIGSNFNFHTVLLFVTVSKSEDALIPSEKILSVFFLHWIKKRIWYYYYLVKGPEQQLPHITCLKNPDLVSEHPNCGCFSPVIPFMTQPWTEHDGSLCWSSRLTALCSERCRFYFWPMFLEDESLFLRAARSSPMLSVCQQMLPYFPFSPRDRSALLIRNLPPTLTEKAVMN